MLWLSRHLERNHADNYLVADVMAKSGAERKKGLKILKNLGSFQHNIDVLKKGHGKLIVVRRTNGKRSAHSYLPCSRCYGFFHKCELYRHSCPCDSSSTDKTRSSATVESSRSVLDAALYADSPQIDRDLKKHVLNRMRQDKTHDLIRSDELILKFGSSLLKKVGTKGRRRIATRMRLLAKVVVTLRKLLDMPDRSLSFFLDGTYFDAVLETVEILSGAGFDEQGQRVFEKPSIVTMVGNLLRKCCGLKKGLAARRSDGEDMSKEVDRFLTLFNSDWSDCMSCPASAAQKASTYNKPDELPSSEDLLKLKQHTQHRLAELTEQLNVEPHYAEWRELSELVLARLIVFNKRRASEPAKMLVSQFVNRPKWCETSNKELLNSLKPIERILMKRMDLVQVPGKRNRRVPILITPEIGRAMQLLVNTRAVCGIQPQNKYFFASDSADGHLDSWLVLRNSAVNAGVSKPRLITSRCLRKYVATLAQVLLICTECDIAVVGCLFGHTCLYVHF